MGLSRNVSPPALWNQGISSTAEALSAPICSLRWKGLFCGLQSNGHSLAICTPYLHRAPSVGHGDQHCFIMCIDCLWVRAMSTSSNQYGNAWKSKIPLQRPIRSNCRVGNPSSVASIDKKGLVFFLGSCGKEQQRGENPTPKEAQRNTE